MTEQAASEPLDDLDLQIKAEYEKTNESATLEPEPSTEVTSEPQAIEPQATATETPTDTGSEYVETENEKVQKRINKMHFEKMEEKRRADALEAQLAEYQSKPQEIEPQIPQPSTDEPKLDDFSEEAFGYDETKRIAAYTAALVNHRVENSIKAQADLQSQQQAQFEAERAKVELDNKYLDEQAQYSVEHPSYIEDIVNLPILSQDKLDLLKGQGGAKMVHYLSKNPEIASQFAASDFNSAAVQLGTLKARLNTKPTSTNKSSAPAPIEPIQGASGAITKSMDEMTIEEICGD